MSEDKNKKRRLVAYPSPLNYKKVVERAEKHELSRSKIVNEALKDYFNKVDNKQK